MRRVPAYSACQSDDDTGGEEWGYGLAVAAQRARLHENVTLGSHPVSFLPKQNQKMRLVAS